MRCLWSSSGKTIPQKVVDAQRASLVIHPLWWDTRKGLRLFDAKNTARLGGNEKYAVSVWPQPGRWRPAVAYARAFMGKSSLFVVLDIEHLHWSKKDEKDFHECVKAFSGIAPVAVTSHGRPDMVSNFFLPIDTRVALGFPQAYNDGRYTEGFQGRVFDKWASWLGASRVVQTLGATALTPKEQMKRNILELWQAPRWTGNIAWWAVENLAMLGITGLDMKTQKGRIATSGDLLALYRQLHPTTDQHVISVQSASYVDPDRYILPMLESAA